ncbi:uncharacterized protein LOC116351728 [Contarinia nasturtii]|uniref:uncharacterized protein LOC116351728 n=1 Tax=Contarinia nasturtii TaxID=265458 RepID=UPI0012D46BD2|nr:uncharacterized protein LOC116351728 [Contarinia nasturtii]
MEALIKQCKDNGDPSQKNFDQLSVGRHTVKKFSYVQTDYGKKVRVDLGKCHMFLPDRFSLNPSQIKDLNRLPKVVMIYGGKDKDRGGRLILNFEEDKKEMVSKKRKTPAASNDEFKKKTKKNAPSKTEKKKKNHASNKEVDENKKKKKVQVRSEEEQSELESSEDDSSDERDSSSAEE